MKPADKVLGGRSSVKVAVVQTPPVYLDREKSVDRACQKIHEAASHGAELIAFTETCWRAIPIGVKDGNPNYRIGFLFASVLRSGSADSQ